MIDYNNLEQFLSRERLDKYLKYTDNDIKLAIKLYELNIEISQSLYLPLNYFEIFLRNHCNNKLVKEINNSWLNSNILFGNNKEKEKLTFKKIEEVKLRIIKHKKEKNILNYIPNNNDIVSNLDLGLDKNIENCDTYYLPIVHGKERTKHQTQKPIKLIEDLVLKHSNEGDFVLDCFAGSGTTGVACQKHNRNCLLVEKEPSYIEIIKTRLSTRN